MPALKMSYFLPRPSNYLTASFHVYDRPCETVLGGIGCIMLPWITRENAEESFHLLRLSKYKVIFCHAELNGFRHAPGRDVP